MGKRLIWQNKMRILVSHFRFWILRGNKKRPGFKAGYLQSKYSFEPGFFFYSRMGKGGGVEKGVDKKQLPLLQSSLSLIRKQKHRKTASYICVSKYPACCFFYVSAIFIFQLFSMLSIYFFARIRVFLPDCQARYVL